MKKKAFIAIAVIVLADIFVAVLLFGPWSKVVSEYTVEAGSVVEPEDFLKRDAKEICFASDSEPFDVTVPGRYIVKLTADNFTRTAVLKVEDTTAPRADANLCILMPGETTEAADLVCNIKDETAVTASFEIQPDYETPGLQEVKVVLEDLGGNKTVIYSNLYISKVDIRTPYVLEAGEEPPKPEWFLKAAGEIAYSGAGLRFVDWSRCNEYPVWLSVDGNECEVRLKIIDTKAPEFTTKPVEGYLNYEVDPALFVDSYKDSTNLSYSYETMPNYSLLGQQEVRIIATDDGGNTAVCPATLSLAPDTEPPVILGAGNISIVVGENVSYKKGVSVTDECDKDVELVIDHSKVDLSTVGTYDVTYSATDSSGNKTEQNIKLTVMPERMEGCDLDTMYALADKVLAKIITPEMTEYDKAWAIYTWTKGNISFISDSEKEDWVESAYLGFTIHKGDCYTYASVSKALLTRAGIPNIDVQRKSTLSHHYWNLVDVGEGWYHFDATPRTDKTTVFMWSESQLNADEAVRRSHVYDKSLYPAVNEN